MWPSVSSPRKPPPSSQTISTTPSWRYSSRLTASLRHAGIAGRRDQALGRRQQSAAAVELQRASLQAESSVDTGNPEVLTDLRGNLVIQVPGRILAAPGIVFPIDAKLLSLGPIFYERRPVVANPAIVGGDRHDLECCRRLESSTRTAWRPRLTASTRTAVLSAINRTQRAKKSGMPWKCPGQVSRLCGQESQR